MLADTKAGSGTGPSIRSEATSSKAGLKGSRTWVIFQLIRPVQGSIFWMKDQINCQVEWGAGFSPSVIGKIKRSLRLIKGS